MQNNITRRRMTNGSSAVDINSTVDIMGGMDEIPLILNDSDFEDDDVDGNDSYNRRPKSRSDRLYNKSVGDALDLPINEPNRQRWRKSNYEKYTKRYRPQESLYTPSRARYAIILVITVLALATRLYRVSQPSSIVFDEVHFGKFAAFYLKGEFFFDVHPPLGKLILAFVGWLGGWDGRDFQFDKIHKEIPEFVPYISMRIACALQGAALPPLAYLTLHNMGYSVIGASLAAGMILFENMFVTQTRFIFLDPPLMLFIALTVYTAVKLHNCRAQAFSKLWVMWMALTGLNLGLAVSVKWIGLFIIALIGLQTLYQLWNVVTDRTQSLPTFGKHFLYRVLFLIVTPLAVYVLLYAYHLRLLTVNGPGSGFMSKDFRKGLYTVVKPGNSTNIPSGTHIRIENDPSEEYRMYMLSNNDRYIGEDTSHQQQVSWNKEVRSEMSFWFVLSHVSHNHPNDTSMDFIYSGDKVYLEHALTQKGLYVHGYPAPVSGETYENRTNNGRLEVSGNEGHGHTWRIDIMNEKPTKRLNSKGKGPARIDQPKLVQGSKFMLIHEITGCALSMSEEELPDWGHRNGEVLCAPVGQRRMDLQTFTLDDFVRERGKEVNLKPPVKDRSGLWTSIKDVWQIQKIAWEANMRLTGSHPYESRPHAWPTLMGGVSYWQNRDKMTQIYLLGNPAIFYSVLLAPIVYVLWLCVWAIRRKRGFVDMDGEKERKFLMAAFLWLGWALHYVPFYFMHRQLFFHHYLPAHYFMILAFGAFMDIFLGVFRSARVRVAAVALLLCAYAWYFHLFASLVYGNVDRSVNDRRWQKKWNYI